MSNLTVNLSSSFEGAAATLVSSKTTGFTGFATTMAYKFGQRIPFVLNFFKNCSPFNR